MVEVTTTTYKLVGDGDTMELVVTPAVYQIQAGGNPSGATTAELVSIQDAGDYYTSDNVEGALQEVGASLSSLDGRVTTAEGNINSLDGRLDTAETNITNLQSDVANIIEPQRGNGISVSGDGSVNLGDQDFYVDNTSGNRVLQGTFMLWLADLDLLKYVRIAPADGVLEVEGMLLHSKRYATTRQTLSISAGLIAWNIANGQSAVVTLTQSATLSNPTNLPASTFTIYPDLEVIQNGTGGWVLSFDSNFVLPSTYVAAPTTANSRTLYHFHQRSDGKLAVNYTHYTT